MTDMAATIMKDSASVHTPAPQFNAPVVTAPVGGLPTKPGHQRHPSLGASASSSFASHRVTRRKSMSTSTSATNIAAVAQAIKDAAGNRLAAAANVRQAVLSPTGTAPEKEAGTHGYPSPPSSLPTPGPLTGNGGPTSMYQGPRTGTSLLTGSAIADGHAAEPNRGNAARNRRASEGASSALGGKRGRSTTELKCDKCGKGYKHSSCLTKHLWEHTPEWSFTSKLLISKHQQVQLLEAASILVSMNPTPPASSSGSNPENASSSSSSDETTPPPGGLVSPLPTPRGIRPTAAKAGKRYSASGSISKSYNGPPSTFLAGSAPTYGAFPNHLPARPPPRPRAGSNVSSVRSTIPMASPHTRPVASAEDDALASAVALLSCSFHTPKMTPAMPVGSVPRTPGLADIGSPSVGRRSYMGPLNEMKKEEGEDEDVDMDRPRDDEDEDRWRSRQRSEEDEDGVFGRMEE